MNPQPINIVSHPYTNVNFFDGFIKGFTNTVK